MSLRETNALGLRTLCEVLREIDDITGTNQEVHKRLVEVEAMAKKMAKALYKYNKEFDKDWWKKNPDYEEDLKRRLNKYYIKARTFDNEV